MILQGAKSMKAYVVGECLDDDDEEEEEDNNGLPSLQEIKEGQDLENPEEDDVVTSQKQRSAKPKEVNRPQARIGRFPRPIRAPNLPPRPHLRGLILPFRRNFDDYEGGPTLEELAPLPEAHLQFQPSLMYICKQIMLTPAPYSLFKDYGYRLLPSFAQAFHLGEPILVEEHLCPVGLPDPPKSLTDFLTWNREGRHGQLVSVDDLVVIGAERLLEIAEEEGDDAILLTGRTIGNHYVCVDLLQDAVEPDHLDFSCDIDSMIWVTQTPRFNSPVAVYSLPVIRDQAPIWKNNHVQVQLLYPQTEDDQMATGGRDEWVTNTHSLSNIPHLLFGMLQGTSVVEILLFFPRMMHRDPHSHFRINRIPKGIQDHFWDHVLLPALRATIPSTRAAYLPVDRSHSAFKMGSGKQSSTVCLDPKDLEKLIKRMKRIVRPASIIILPMDQN
jgi:hypothetical protein